MTAAEIYDYLTQMAPDYNVVFSEEIFKPVKEMISRTQKIHYGDDGSEEIITFASGPIAYLEFGWDGLLPADAGTVFDWYMDASKANGMERSFPFVHPEDDHLYVARFDMVLDRTVNPLSSQHAIPNIRIKLKGILTSVVNVSYSWTQSGANGNEYYCDQTLTEPTKVFFNRVIGSQGSVGSLGVEEWDFADNDSLGSDHLYVRLTGNVDPDTKDDNWIEIG